jgi:chemotaxis protein CheD
MTTEVKSQELLPGDVAIAQAGDQLSTLLGSCVSVILTDAKRTVGAMCHIVHVGRPPQRALQDTSYGEAAMAEMFRLLQQKGFNPQACQAFVYGGGNMFPAIARAPLVGDRNVQWVLDFLASRGIQVLQTCVQGEGHRMISWTVGPQLPQVAQGPARTS